MCALGRCVLPGGQVCGAGEQPCGHPSRVLCGELPGSSGNGPLIVAHSGGQGTRQLSVRQPGQSKSLVPFQGCSELFGGCVAHLSS